MSTRQFKLGLLLDNVSCMDKLLWCNGIIFVIAVDNSWNHHDWNVVLALLTWLNVTHFGKCSCCTLTMQALTPLCWLYRPSNTIPRFTTFLWTHCRRCLYTRVDQKTEQQTHDHNSVKSWPILKMFSLKDFWVNLQLNGHWKSHRTLHMLLHYLVKH